MKNKLLVIFSILVILVLSGLGYGVHYLFNYAIIAGDKSFIQSQDKEKQEKDWAFVKESVKGTALMSADGLLLKGRQIHHPNKTNRVVIMAHGYMGDSLEMGKYAHLFYDLGYDVLAPDNRGHGKSEGKYAGFGWLDKKDYQLWINQIIDEYGSDVEIVLFGVSMGAATVMMTSGEDLPKQVKVIIEDCGYDTVENELTYQLNELFNAPSFPLIPLTSLYTKLRVGYGFKEASAVKQLQKNERPILFIHGSADTFVPTDMVYSLYDATKGPKDLVIFEHAGHAKSYQSDKEKYKKTVSDFLNHYMLEN